MLNREIVLGILRQVKDYYIEKADEFKPKKSKTKYACHTPQGVRLLRHSKVANYIINHFEVGKDGRFKLAFSLDDIAMEVPDVDKNVTLASDIKQVLISFEKRAGFRVVYDPTGYYPKSYSGRH